ncbi:AAA family ATPase [Pseudenhygromyxa sp. WMMC2535]|uniref:nitrogenase component 1 n=1 Tax=Pseudenhygromyxa sp. WMMC2535 TaxID=2712867 RepID=UPI0015528E9C|nr:nitrogenase component 1 [Pseudenhygromyxa sp. WMMC2535]NVB41386.1 AAA family ATPase [Pseudenhygromyxa sp. WMMC2535]NVB43696.1 AAA family ATPase [Pseudenhygromyxa sp. WMMC2535]
MERVVIFGKGGIGKSTISCGISASLAAAGKRVLHVGCDPKHDSTAALLRGKLVDPVVDRIERVRGVAAEDIVVRSPLGVDCVEAGGPAAGVGCGGRGITRMLEIFGEAGLLDEARYDIALYDVLGDVVCGGFAAPLRRGIGEKVVIVTSEELMALYAANNIARAVVHYAQNGIALAGLVVNLKDPQADRQVVERFAARLNTQVLAWIPRDPLIREAEFARTTVVEAFPGAPISRALQGLAEQLFDERVDDRPLPTPMSEQEFHVAARARFRGEREAAAAAELEAEQRQADAVLAPVALVSPASLARNGKGGGQEQGRDGPQPSAQAKRGGQHPGEGSERGARGRGAGQGRGPAGADHDVGRDADRGAGQGRDPRTEALFAELRGELPSNPESVYEQHEVRLSRPGLAAGVEATRRFEQAFGLVGKLRSLKRTDDGTVEFVAEVDERGSLACGVLGPPGVPAWREGKSFTASYRGKALDPVIARALARFMARYDGVPFEQILDQIRPEAGDEHMLANDYQESLFYAFAPASGWRRFFEGTELYRGTCSARQGKVAIVDHTDIECFFHAPISEDWLPSFFNTPACADEDRVAHVEGRARMLFTDIGDVDVIKGADRLVDEALELLAELPESERPDSVVVQGGCLPEVTGDDLEASAARTRGKLRLPVLAVGQHNDPSAKALGEGFAGREISSSRPLDATGVVLMGMPAFIGRDELVALLEAAGISVLATVLPEMDEDSIDQLCRAGLLVEYPWERYEVPMARIGERLVPARRVRPPAPFGLEGSRRWLMTIARALGRGAQMAEVLEPVEAGLRERWSALQARARRIRVGFVIEHAHWRSVLSARRSLGVPLLEILGEMGFGVDVLAYAGTRSKPPPEERYDELRIRWYRDVDELDALLGAGEVAAWYSEMHYDRRLTRKGCNTFSMRALNMGPRGALNSLEAMLDAVELPFYRSYARFLGSAFLEAGDRGAR